MGFPSVLHDNAISPFFDLLVGDCFIHETHAVPEVENGSLLQNSLYPSYFEKGNPHLGTRNLPSYAWALDIIP